MTLPHGESTPQTELQQDIDRVLAGVLEGRVLAPLVVVRRPRAWERALPPPVTAADVKAAWRKLDGAREGSRITVPLELFQSFEVDFRDKLEAWLNA